MEGYGGFYAFQAVLLQRPTAAGEGLATVGTPDDELAYHRVVERRYVVACEDCRVHPDAGPAGHLDGRDLPRRREKVILRVLGVYAELY